MPKNEFDKCSYCGVSVKKKNMEDHINKIHSSKKSKKRKNSSVKINNKDDWIINLIKCEDDLERSIVFINNNKFKKGLKSMSEKPDFSSFLTV